MALNCDLFQCKTMTPLYTNETVVQMQKAEKGYNGFYPVLLTIDTSMMPLTVES